METKQPSLTILMLPWLAHGHISPCVELAKKLSTKNFKIFLCSSPIALISVREALKTTSDVDVPIELIELNVPSSPDLPPEYHVTKHIPPNMEPKLREAFHESKSHFTTLITSIKPDLLLYDFFPKWAPTLASSLGIPVVHFSPTSAAAYSFYYHLFTNNRSHFPYNEMYLRDYELEDFNATQLSDDVFSQVDLSSHIILIKTCRALEGKYMDYFSAMCHKKIVPVGPLVTPSLTQQSHSDIIKWLSTKNQHSTVFISFGSENYLSLNQIAEMAKGLELASNVNFIWVLRFPPEVKASIDKALPEGFVERVKERGIIIQGWAPQATILGHPSIGAFASHCGMSSTIESAYLGVPVIGIPFKIDQPLNVKVLVEQGVAIELQRGANGHFTGEEVADVLNRVFVMKTGDEMRLKAAELRKKMKSEEEYAMSEVAEQLRHLCAEHKAMSESKSI